jgi:hypothetical protein
MPLIQGCSKEAVEENISKLVSEGRSREQAFAIAASIADDNMKKCGEERQQEIRNGEYT